MQFKLLYKSYNIWFDKDKNEYVVFDGGMQHHLDTVDRAKQLIDFLQIHYSMAEKGQDNARDR